MVWGQSFTLSFDYPRQMSSTQKTADVWRCVLKVRGRKSTKEKDWDVHYFGGGGSLTLHLVILALSKRPLPFSADRALLFLSNLTAGFWRPCVCWLWVEHRVWILKFDRWLVTTCLCDLRQFPHLSSENIDDLGFLLVLVASDSFWDHGRIRLHSLTPLTRCSLCALCGADVRATMRWHISQYMGRCYVCGVLTVSYNFSVWTPFRLPSDFLQSLPGTCFSVPGQIPSVLVAKCMIQAMPSPPVLSPSGVLLSVSQ